MKGENIVLTSNPKEIQKHIKTHTVHSAMDCDLNKNSELNLSLTRISFARDSARFFV